MIGTKIPRFQNAGKFLCEIEITTNNTQKKTVTSKVKTELVASDKKAAKDPIKAFLAILEYQEWRESMMGFLMIIFTVAVPIWTLEYFSSYKNLKKGHRLNYIMLNEKIEISRL